MRAIGRLEHSDWAILFTVAVAIIAVLVIGVLGARLASLGPSGTRFAPAPLVVPTVAPAAPPPAAAPAATPAPAAISTVETGSPGGAARLRAEPRLDAAILERLPQGVQVTELGPEAAEGPRKWRQVRSSSGAVGWVDASLLRGSNR